MVELESDSLQIPLAAMKVHEFYFIKLWPCEDSTSKCRIADAAKLIKTMNQKRLEIMERIEEHKFDRKRNVLGLKRLDGHDRYFREDKAWRESRINSLKLSLDKLSFANNAYQDRAIRAFVVAEDANFHNLHFRLRHGSNSLAAEKHLLREATGRQDVGSCLSWKELNGSISRLKTQAYYTSIDEIWRRQLLEEIKRLERAKEKAIANAAVKGAIWNSLGSKEEIQKQINFIRNELEDLRKKHLPVKAKIKRAKKDLEVIEEEIKLLQKQLIETNRRKGRAYQCILKLRKQHDYQNSWYYEHLSLLKNAKDLAEKKDLATLRDLSSRQVDEFMSKWNNNKAFRDDYEKTLAPSLDSNQLSRDGRMKNTGEN